MKSSTVLFVLFTAFSRTEAKPSSVYHVGILGHVVPALYLRQLLGQRHPWWCFENKIFNNCSTSSQNFPYRLVAKSIRNQSQISPIDKLIYQRTYNADIRKPEKINDLSALVNKNEFTMKLGQPYLKNIVKFFPTLYEKNRSMKEETTEISPNEVNTFETLFENEEPIEKWSTKKSSSEQKNSVENKSEEAWYEVVETLKPSIENVKASSEFVENNISPIDEIASDQECIFNTSFIFALDQFERKLYSTNFNKFLALTPTENGDSGMSFVQSGLFLGISLMALSTEVDLDTKKEIDQSLELCVSDLEKIELIKRVMLSLPNSSEELKYHRSSRLVLRPGRQLSEQFSLRTAEALQMKIDHFEDAQTPEMMAHVLNRMIEKDSDGAIRDTFDEEDLSENEEAVLITTLYFRARWRSAPTLLNGTWTFRDTRNTPSKTVRMIRINDIIKYVDLPEWDAEAIEIPYLTEGLSLLMIVPRGNSLRSLVEQVASANLSSVNERMQSIRTAVSLPLYTLRMTLLLPNKLQAMEMSLIVVPSGAQNGSLRLSQAVQRIMFWAEAGRNAYKDDGLEWDAPPEMKIMVDRPYIFFVRWKNISLMIGNFVL